MKKSTKQAAWAIIWLTFLTVAFISSAHPFLVERLGEYAAVLEGLVVVAALILACWLWKGRGTLEGKRRHQRGGDIRTLTTLAVGMEKDVQSVVLRHIRTRLGIGFDNAAVIGPKNDALLMKWLLEHEYVSKEAVGKAVHERLCEIGRIMYERDILSWGRFPDDPLVLSNALRYAIFYGVISKEEAGKIRFDHSETAEEYRTMAEGLHENVMRQLGAGDAYFSLPKLSDDDCCCCYCGH